ncbi:MAG: dihydroneopterin aldolase [Bacteroidota bacterium]
MTIDYSVIRLRNATFYAYHGTISDEQNLGGKFEVDVDLYCDFVPAAESDSLKQTVNYERVYSFIENIVTGRKYYLIETVARTIAKELLREFSKVNRVVVRVRKRHVPIKGVIDYVEAEFSETRS